MTHQSPTRWIQHMCVWSIFFQCCQQPIPVKFRPIITIITSYTPSKFQVQSSKLSWIFRDVIFEILLLYFDGLLIEFCNETSFATRNGKYLSTVKNLESKLHFWRKYRWYKIAPIGPCVKETSGHFLTFCPEIWYNFYKLDSISFKF